MEITLFELTTLLAIMHFYTPQPYYSANLYIYYQGHVTGIHTICKNVACVIFYNLNKLQLMFIVFGTLYFESSCYKCTVHHFQPPLSSCLQTYFLN